MDLTKELQRGGVRGGRDMFNWETVKNMPNRERQQYLGASTKIGVGGRFGRFDRNDWWRNEKQSTASRETVFEEKESVKRMEEDLMNQALGLRPNHQLGSQRVAQPDIQIKKEVANAVDIQLSGIPKIEETEADFKSVTGLGFRKYLNPTDWTNVQAVEDVLEGEDILEPTVIKQETQAVTRPRRVFGPVRPPPVQIKEEATEELANERRRDRSRSRHRY
jgi:hypothetical protein